MNNLLPPASVLLNIGTGNKQYTNDGLTRETFSTWNCIHCQVDSSWALRAGP